MLERLLINNFAVIEELEVEFGPGLTVLTGETGAGKSIIVDALTMLLGERASVEMLRSGTERALIQGVFSIDGASPLVAMLGEWGIEEQQELIVTRELSPNRSLCRINGRAVNQSVLKSLGALLVDMHGQHQHQSLLRSEAHLHLVDKYGGEAIQVLLQITGECAQGFRRCEREIRELSGDERERARLIDLLEFQIKEIKSAQLRVGEEEETRSERDQLLHYEKISTAVEKAYEVLYSGQSREIAVVDLVGRVVSSLTDIIRFYPALQPTVGTVEQALFLIQDASRELAILRENLVHEPERLEELERRIDAINRLKGKYGVTIEQIFAFQQEAAASLEKIHGSRERVDALLQEMGRIRKRYASATAELSVLRREVGGELVASAEANLQELGLKGARLELCITDRDPHALHPLGNEDLEFLFSANMGEELRSLSKVASGGEISRVMLALKAVLSSVDEIPTLVFDEIDNGVGGRTAHAVAEKVAQVSSGRQVLCITHLPQIAAAAKTHLFVAKREEGGRTYTTITSLAPGDRVKELARMLSGEDHDVALNHARELLIRQTMR